MTGRRNARVLIALAGVALPVSARGQCTQSWNRHPPSPPTTAYAMVVHDDGSGPALYAGGNGRLSKWNGIAWASFTLTGQGSAVLALASYDDDGAGPHPPALYVGGTFNSIGGVPIVNFARWDGSTWSPAAAVDGDVRCFATADEGPAGPRVLYVGGAFGQIGGVAASRIARWNGTAWSALGSGIGSGEPWALATLDADGAGPATPILYAAGGFGLAGGVSVSNIAQWDGQAWAPLGTGIGNQVFSLSIFDDDGPGPHPEALYAGGRFDRAGSVWAECIAKWDGTDWSDLNGGTGIHDFPVYCTFVWDSDGPGPTLPALFVGGWFDTIGGVPAYRHAKWNGSEWSELPGLADPAFSASDVWAFGAFDGALFASGHFRNQPFTQSWTMIRWGCPMPCYPNCDGSTTPPILNALDFNCFLNAFSAGQSYANCDASTAPPALNVLDFNCFLNRFTAGCQ